MFNSSEIAVFFNVLTIIAVQALSELTCCNLFLNVSDVIFSFSVFRLYYTFLFPLFHLVCFGPTFLYGLVNNDF